MGFSRQEYCSVLPFPPPGDLPNTGIESLSLKSPALAGGFFTTKATWEAIYIHQHIHIIYVLYASLLSKNRDLILYLMQQIGPQ